MDEVRTKHGRVGFGQDKLIITESYLDYFRNLYEELWIDGKHHYKLAMFLFVTVIAYSISLLAAILNVLTSEQLVVFSISSITFFWTYWLIQWVRGFRKKKNIKYSSIEEVKFVYELKWVNSPRFIITYQSNGEKYRRNISMHREFIPRVEERIKQMKKGFKSEEIDIS